MKAEMLQLLRQRPGLAYCGHCLSKLANVPAHEAQSAWADLVADRAIEVTQGACSECLNVRTVVRFKSRGSN